VSVYQNRVMTCLHCRHDEIRSVAVSLEASGAGEEREAILADKFQRFTCQHCGVAYRADGPLIYLDFDDKLWIGVFPTPWEEAWWEYEREPEHTFDRNMLEHAPPIVRSWAPGFTIRAVFGIERLREKLVAHAAGIDDRVLEAYKLGLLRDMGPFEPSGGCRPRLRSVDATHAVFHVPRPEPLDPTRLAIVKVSRKEITRVASDPECARTPRRGERRSPDMSSTARRTVSDATNAKPR
jgi:hypothetical protein